MKSIKGMVCVFSILFFIGCKERQAKAIAVPENGQAEAKTERPAELKLPIEVNPLGEYEKKTLMLEEIADIEYIPLETSKDVLLSGMTNGICMSDSLIVSKNREGSVYVFGRDGRLVSRFNHTGRGPGEYQSIIHFTVDFDADEIYIYDFMLHYKVYVYSLTGDLKRSFNVPARLWIEDFTDYDENNLLVYTRISEEAMEKHKGAFRPYYLMSKQNGTFKPLDLEVAEMKDGRLYMPYKVGNKNRSRLAGFKRSPIIRNGGDFYISDFASDTIYTFNHRALKPFIVCKPSLQRLEKSRFFEISAKTARYTFLYLSGMNKEAVTFTRNCIAIDHKTGEIFEPDFQGSDFVKDINNFFCSLLPEYSIVPIPALLLTDFYQKGKLTGKLKEIASGLKEDSNPVLMLIKFRK